VYAIGTGKVSKFNLALPYTQNGMIARNGLLGCLIHLWVGHLDKRADVGNFAFVIAATVFCATVAA
jgi:hypothetical protein